MKRQQVANNDTTGSLKSGLFSGGRKDLRRSLRDGLFITSLQELENFHVHISLPTRKQLFGCLLMDERFEEIFNSIPPDEPRSRLEPYRELILRWRRQGRTYRRIQGLLAEQFSVEVATPTLFRFIQRRSRPRNEEPAAAPAAVTQTPAETPAAQPATSQPRRRYSPEEIAAMRAAASVENHKPSFPVEEDTKPVFRYDPTRPLTNKPSAKKEEE
jgi:hypothetical protein